MRYEYSVGDIGFGCSAAALASGKNWHLSTNSQALWLTTQYDFLLGETFGRISREHPDGGRLLGIVKKTKGVQEGIERFVLEHLGTTALVAAIRKRIALAEDKGKEDAQRVMREALGLVGDLWGITSNGAGSAEEN